MIIEKTHLFIQIKHINVIFSEIFIKCYFSQTNVHRIGFVDPRFLVDLGGRIRKKLFFRDSEKVTCQDLEKVEKSVFPKKCRGIVPTPFLYSLPVFFLHLFPILFSLIIST